MILFDANYERQWTTQSSVDVSYIAASKNQLMVVDKNGRMQVFNLESGHALQEFDKAFVDENDQLFTVSDLIVVDQI